MLLPSIVLAIGSVVVYYRLLRNDLIATLQEDFITMARSKGLSDRRVLLRHALRPSSFSLLASAGLTIAGLIAGAFVVEILFQLPGLGYQLIDSHRPARLPRRPGHRPGGGRSARGHQLQRRHPLHLGRSPRIASG